MSRRYPPQVADWLALRQDWEVVGNDFRAVMAGLENSPLQPDWKARDGIEGRQAPTEEQRSAERDIRRCGKRRVSKNAEAPHP